MSRSTRVEPQINAQEFLLLREIVKRTVDFESKALLESATSAYEQVLKEHDINVENDKVYFSALLRLHHYPGESWHKKLVKAAEEIETNVKRRDAVSKHHKKHSSNNDFWQAQRDHKARSVLQQKLDRAAEFNQDNPFDVTPRLFSDQHEKSGPAPNLTTEQKHALALRYQEIVRLQSNRKCQVVFEHWQSATRLLQQYRDREWQFAVERDHQTLKLQALEIWHEVYSSRADMHIDFVQLRESAILSRAYRQWQNHIIARREGEHRARLAAKIQALLDEFVRKRRRKILQRHLRTWRVVFRRFHRSKSQAIILRNKANKLVAWRTWFFRVCEIKTAAVYDRKVVSMALHFWKARSRHIQILQGKAELYLDDALYLGYWDVWKAAYAEWEILLDRAELHHTRKVKQRYLSAWRTSYSLARRYDTVQATIDDRILQTHFVRWITSFSLLCDKRRKARSFRLGKILQCWRLESRFEVIRSDSNQHLKIKALDQWTLQKSFRAVRANTKRRLLLHWRESCDTLLYRLHKAENEAIASIERQVKLRVLKLWQTRQTRIADYENRAMHLYMESLYTSTVSIWQKLLTSRDAQHDSAVRWERQSVRHRTLTRWHHCLITRWQREREDKLQALHNHQADCVLRGHFGAWRRRYKSIDEMRHRAESLDMEKILPVCFRTWLNLRFDRFDMHCQALDFEERTLQTVVARVVKGKLQIRMQLSEMADDLYIPKMHKIGRQKLQKWYRSWQQYSDFEAFGNTRIARLEKNVQREAFRRWRTRSRGLSRNEEMTYIEGHSSDLLDASRTRVEWRLEPSSTVFQRQLLEIEQDDAEL